jgi:hypothetical protein
MRRSRACAECGQPKTQEQLTTVLRGMAAARVCEPCKAALDLQLERPLQLATRPTPLGALVPPSGATLDDLVARAFCVHLIETPACATYLTQGRVGAAPGATAQTLRGAAGDYGRTVMATGIDLNQPYNTVVPGAWLPSDDSTDNSSSGSAGEPRRASNTPPASQMRPLSRSARTPLQHLASMPRLHAQASPPLARPRRGLDQSDDVGSVMSWSSGDDNSSSNGGTVAEPPPRNRAASNPAIDRNYGVLLPEDAPPPTQSRAIYGQLHPEDGAAPAPVPPRALGRTPLYGKLGPEGDSPSSLPRALSGGGGGGGGGANMAYGQLAPEMPTLPPRKTRIVSQYGAKPEPLTTPAAAVAVVDATSPTSTMRKPLRSAPTTPSAPAPLVSAASSPPAAVPFRGSQVRAARLTTRASVREFVSDDYSALPPNPVAAAAALALPPVAVDQYNALPANSANAGVRMGGAAPGLSPGRAPGLGSPNLGSAATGPDQYNAIPLPPDVGNARPGLPPLPGGGGGAAGAPYMSEAWFHPQRDRFGAASLMESVMYQNGAFLFVSGEIINSVVLVYKRDGRVLARDIKYLGGLFQDVQLSASMFRSLSEYVRTFNSHEQQRVLTTQISADGVATTMPTNPGDFALEEFYHNIDSDGAMMLLRRPTVSDGDYLFRASKSTTADPQLSLSYRDGDAVRHQRITWNAKKMVFEQHGSVNTFPTLQALVKAVNNAAQLNNQRPPLRNLILRSEVR